MRHAHIGKGIVHEVAAVVSEQLQVRELAAPKECSPHWRAWPRAWLTRSNIVCCRSVGAHASDAGDASLAEEAGACVIQSVVIHAIEQEDGGWYSLEKSERSVKNLNQESHPLWVKAYPPGRPRATALSVSS